jgi:hypothetical protein
MSVHNAIQNYIHDLQDLLKETNEQALIDKARELWGQDDARYEVLEQFVESPSKFNKPAKPAEPEPSNTSENKPVK